MNRQFFRTMWQKGSRAIIKVLCMWIFLGAYSFWKHKTTSISNGSEEAKELPFTRRSGPISSSRKPDQDSSIHFKDAFKYPSVDTGAGYGSSFDTAIASSRHLLAALPNCTPRAVEQFPSDFLTDEQRKGGFLILHILIALYMFLALAIVCDRYFVPSLEVLCELFNLQTDVAGATFMAAGSSAPELATAVIGVFVAKADVGLSTVVGSAIYNVMFVISMCALFATSVVQLHWWPLFRDCIAYLWSVVALILVIHDAVVQWYETIVLIILYALYVVFMFFNERLEQWCVPRVNQFSGCTGKQTQHPSTYENIEGDSTDNMKLTEIPEKVDHAHHEAETWHKLCERPEGVVWTVLWALSMPLSIVMFLTVPDCRRPALRNLFWLTFLLSLVWLSAFCFLMVWMITVIGYTANIPDSVMSLTLIAFGVSLPDVVASVLVVRDGLGDMAMSNAIGSNVFDILVCLGVPWFLQTCIKDPGSTIPVYSEGLVYSSVMLLSTVAFLLLVTHLNGWQLTKRYGIVLLIVYILYTVLASLYELNVFGKYHPPECPSSY